MKRIKILKGGLVLKKLKIKESFTKEKNIIEILESYLKTIFQIKNI